MFYYYIKNGIRIGYIKYKYIGLHKIYIEYITIYKNYRGNHYSNEMFNLFVKSVSNNIHFIELEAKEKMENFNKLFHLYESWGLKPSNVTSFYSDTIYTYRKKIFNLSLPIYKNNDTKSI